jgi:hypothetical protein
VVAAVHPHELAGGTLGSASLSLTCLSGVAIAVRTTLFLAHELFCPFECP